MAFTSMNRDEREKWLELRGKEGMVSEDGKPLPLLDRVVRALKAHGPMTTSELMGKALSTQKGLTNWGAANPEVLAEAGIRRERNPDNGKTLIWFLDYDMGKEQVIKTHAQSSPKPGGIFSRLHSSVDARST